jgi:hypothetical protein
MLGHNQAVGSRMAISGLMTSASWGVRSTPRSLPLLGLLKRSFPVAPLRPHVLLTVEWQSYRRRRPSHTAVRHGIHEWAREADGDGLCEVHGNSCAGAGAALRTYLRAFRGVHKQSLPLYVATYAARVNATRVTLYLIRRMCVGTWSAHTDHT